MRREASFEYRAASDPPLVERARCACLRRTTRAEASNAARWVRVRPADTILVVKGLSGEAWRLEVARADRVRDVKRQIVGTRDTPAERWWHIRLVRGEAELPNSLLVGDDGDASGPAPEAVHMTVDLTLAEPVDEPERDLLREFREAEAREAADGHAPERRARGDFVWGAAICAGAMDRTAFATEKATGRRVAVRAFKKFELLRFGMAPTMTRCKAILERMAPHPFVIRLHATFADARFLYFVHDYQPGGELFKHLRLHGRFALAGARVYAACVASALGHCHAHETVVRNVTPETIRLTAAGWPVLTDFEFAKQVGARGRTYTLCGRADYLPPEMVLNRGCGPGHDWWGLGVLTYEMIAGVPPFAPFDGVATHAETYRRILRGKPRFFPPVLWAEGGKQFVAGLLVQRPEARLGSKPGDGVAQVAASKFLQRVDFERLARPENPLQAPFVPHVAADDDTSNYDPYPDSDEPMPVVWNRRMTGEDPFKGIGFD